MIVATAGHIDHGKTTLVKALTGVDTDRLPEEKARGISIDLGFAYYTTAEGNVVGFVDVPGHERFVRNMLAGVCGIDYVMMIVAADDGVKPQTEEHLHIVDLLEVNRGIVVITKSDRAAAERITEVAAQMRALLASTRLASIEILPVSAMSGDGIDQVRRALATAAAEVGRRPHAGRNFRLAIDRVFSVVGSGTVVTGTVFDGSAVTGDKLMLTPGGIEVRVRGIQKAGKVANRADAGERCALNLARADVDQVQRGDWVVAPFLYAPTTRFDVRLRLLPSEAKPLKHWTPVHLHLGTGDAAARVAIRRGASVEPGASVFAQMITDRPMSAFHGDRFILRDQSARRTIGGGAVINPLPDLRMRNSELRAAQLAALEHPNPEEALGALLVCSPAGVDLARFQRVFNLTDTCATALVQRPEVAVLGREPRVVLPRSRVDTMKRNLLDALAHYHQESPRALGVEVSSLRQQLSSGLSARTFDALVRELGDEGLVELTGSMLRSSEHSATDNPADEAIWRSVRPLLYDAGFQVPSLRQLAFSTRIAAAHIEDFLYRKSRSGELIRVGANRFFPRSTLARLAAVADAVGREAPDGRFTVAQFRDAIGIGRSLSIDILECFERLGIARRLGDYRMMHKDFVPILGPAEAPARPALP